MKQILYTIALAALLAACTDEKFTDGPLPSGGGDPGVPVSVGLSLKTQPVQSPLSLQSKAGSPVFGFTEVCKGLEVSLVETPVTRAIVDNKIQNFWVLQFNGTTSISRLVKKSFHSVPVAGVNNALKNVELTASTTANRIIVIANVKNDTFTALTENATSGTQLSAFENEGIVATTTGFPLFQNGADTLIVLAGNTDMIVTADKQADIQLYRTVAKVTANITVAKKMVDKNHTLWQGKIMHVPAKSFYFSIGRNAVFPQPATGYVDYPATTVPQGSITPNTNGSISFSSTAYLPVNLQHPVPYTTPVLRGTNAPADATYLQIMGVTTVEGTISQSVIYQIHLGANFTDNYSISPNYDYTYNITIADENEDDSRVVKFIPGYFGGSLKTYKEDGVTSTEVTGEKAVWRYEKRIEVYLTNVAYTAPSGTPPNTFIGAWSNGSTAAANSLTAGRTNTWALNNDNYPAARTCIKLNSGSPASADELMWFLPAYDQALGIYIAGSNTVKAFPDVSYWTSSTDGTNAWNLKIKEGETGKVAPATNNCYLRCIRELTPTP